MGMRLDSSKSKSVAYAYAYQPEISRLELDLSTWVIDNYLALAWSRGRDPVPRQLISP